MSTRAIVECLSHLAAYIVFYVHFYHYLCQRTFLWFKSALKIETKKTFAHFFYGRVTSLLKLFETKVNQIFRAIEAIMNEREKTIEETKDKMNTVEDR